MSNERYDFFLSFSDPDRGVADRIYQLLTNDGYSVYYQHTHMRPGTDFLERMEHGLSNSDRLIAILSPHYARSLYAMAELRAILVEDPSGEKGRLVPFLVELFRPPKLLASRVHVSLVDALQDENALRDTVLAAIGAKEEVEIQQIAGSDSELPETTRGSVDVVIELSCGRRVEGADFIDKLQDAIHGVGLVRGDENNIMVCVNELMDNAYEHGCKTGSEKIVFDFAVTKRSAWMTVTNRDPMSREHVTRIQQILNDENEDEEDEPFQRGNGLRFIKSTGARVELTKDNRGIEVVLPLTHFTGSGSKFSEEITGNFLVVTIGGVIDHETAHAVEKELTVHQRKAQDMGIGIIVNLIGLEYMSTVGFRLFMRLSKGCMETDVELRICNLNETLEELFRISRYDKVIPLYDTLDQALL